MFFLSAGLHPWASIRGPLSVGLHPWVLSHDRNPDDSPGLRGRNFDEFRYDEDVLKELPSLGGVGEHGEQAADFVV